MRSRILSFVFMFILISFSTEFVKGQWVQKSAGIHGGSPICYALSGSTIFAGTFNDGVYRSTDGGLTWKPASKGLSHYAWITCLSAKNNKIYAGDYFTGVYVSANNGDSWTSLNSGLSNTQINCFSVVGSDLFAGTNNGINVLHENNTTWTPIGNGFGASATILAIQKNENYMFASEAYSGKIFRSGDSGATWSSTSSGLPTGYVRYLKQNGSRMFASTSAGLYTSANNGDFWTKIDGGLPGDGIDDILIDGSNMLVATSVGPFKSVDGGTTWKLSNTGFGFNYCSVFLTAGAKIFLGGYGSSIYSSSDFGTTWNDSAQGFVSLVVTAFETINGKLLAGTERGVYRSADNGNTWQQADNGTSNLSRAFPSGFLKDGNRVYAAFDGIGVKVTDNEGTSWADFSAGLTTSSVSSIIKNENTLFVCSTQGVFKYSSASSSWLLCSSDIPMNSGKLTIVRCLAVSNGKIFAGVNNNGIYTSNDNGNSWTKLNSQLSNQSVTNLLVKGDTLFATVDNDIYMSVDQGVNWTKTITNNNNVLYKLFIVDGTLFAAGWNGIFYSLDQGISWLPSKDGFPEIAAGYSFFSDGAYLLAGTSEGIWSIPLSDFYPSIHSVSPVAAGPNEFVTISGKNFNPSLSTNLVLFNGKKATVLQATSTSLTVSVPADATSGYIKVIVNNKTATSSQSFCVRPVGPVISATGLGTSTVVLSSNVSGIQWYLNSFPIKEATASTYTATQDGVFTAKIIGGECDSQPSNPIPVVITDIETHSSNLENLDVYPNPATDNIVVTTNNLFNGELIDVEIVGIDGRQKKYLQVKSRPSLEISISEYSEGLYFVRVTGQRKTITSRFLKFKSSK
jgi:hypothetical protein